MTILVVIILMMMVVMMVHVPELVEMMVLLAIISIVMVVTEPSISSIMTCGCHQTDHTGEEKTSNEQTYDQYLAYSHYTIFM
jgi:hypothetical protein